MSRNIGSTHCKCCRGSVVLEELALGGQVKGCTFANAHCEDCEAKYIAWVTWPTADRWSHRGPDDPKIIDLSFRHAFNDEPSPEDLPLYGIEERTFPGGELPASFASWERFGASVISTRFRIRLPYPTCDVCGNPRPTDFYKAYACSCVVPELVLKQLSNSRKQT